MRDTIINNNSPWKRRGELNSAHKPLPGTKRTTSHKLPLKENHPTTTRVSFWFHYPVFGIIYYLVSYLWITGSYQSAKVPYIIMGWCRYRPSYVQYRSYVCHVQRLPTSPQLIDCWILRPTNITNIPSSNPTRISIMMVLLALY